MKKGKIRIIIGSILIFLQLLSIIGNAKTGINLNLSFDNFSVFLYDLIFLLSYFLIGIIGLILLISGLHSYNKKPKTAIQQEIIPIENQQEPIIEETLPSKRDIKQPKRRFCKLCGGKINSTTKKCSQCGKQYFKGIKLNKHTITILALALLLIASVIINIIQYSEHSYLLTDYAQSKFYASSLEKENEKQQNWINHYETLVVAIVKGSKIYHKGSCEHIKGETINLAWKTGIEDMGYTACPYCHN